MHTFSKEISHKSGGTSDNCRVNNNTKDEPGIIHFNHAGASPSPPVVLDAVIRHLQLEQKYGGYTAASMAQDKLDQVYKRVAELIHATDSSDTDYYPRHEIALVESATVAWTRLFYSMVQHQHCKRQRKQQRLLGTDRATATASAPAVILVSEAEYAANVVAACQWAKDHPAEWTVLSIPSTQNPDGSNTGRVNVNALEEMIQGTFEYSMPSTDSSVGGSTTTTSHRLDPADIALVCITHVPTNCGMVNPVYEIGALLAEYNNNQQKQWQKDGKEEGCHHIMYLVDACQSVGQMDVNVRDMHCHGLVATGRKFLRGPRGTGFLYTPRAIANQLIPHHVDHVGLPIVTVPNVSHLTNLVSLEHVLDIQPKEGAARFEFYESNLAGKLGLGQAILYATNDAGGMDVIFSVCRLLARELSRILVENMPTQVHVHHPPPECGIVTFWVEGISAESIKQQLWEASDDHGESPPIRFETSLVPATSTPLDSAQTGVPNMVRVSVSYTNTMEDIAAFCRKLRRIIYKNGS